MRFVKALIPLLLFAVISVFLYRGLSNDPRLIPSPLIDKPAPAFSLPRLDDGGPWAPEAMSGQVWLLNVFGSWCAACVVEHPVLTRIAAAHRQTDGTAYLLRCRSQSAGVPTADVANRLRVTQPD